MTDVIVTGLPRSGSTVVSALIDHLPDAVCFNRPEAHLARARRSKAKTPYCKWLIGDYAWRRARLLRQEPMRDFRDADGLPLLDSQHDSRQPRDESGKPVSILFAKPDLKGDFILGMRHHALYTALLPALVRFDHFKIIAVIRSPLDTIVSWQTLKNQNFARGVPPGIAHLWPRASSVQRRNNEAMDRMVQMYELYVQRYHRLQDHVHIVKYEDVVRDPIIVSRLFGVNAVPPSASFIEQRNPIHPVETVENLRASLRKYGVFAKEYYGEL